MRSTASAGFGRGISGFGGVLSLGFWGFRVLGF